MCSVTSLRKDCRLSGGAEDRSGASGRGASVPPEDDDGLAKCFEGSTSHSAPSLGKDDNSRRVGQAGE